MEERSQRGAPFNSECVSTQKGYLIWQERNPVGTIWFFNNSVVYFK